MMFKPTVLAIAALCCISGAANAGIVTVTGDTTATATFNRPLEDLSALSAVGTAVHYDTYSFSASQAGTYSFLTTGLFDTFTFLYNSPFNPASSLTNVLAANDDLLPPLTTVSGFSFALAANTMYTYVVAAFDNSQFGRYSTTIGGPGTITAAVSAVPEPSTWALMALGIAGLGIAAARKNRQLDNAKVKAV